MNIEQVQLWSVAGGIGCIVMPNRSDTAYTACGLLRFGGQETVTKPPRVCVGCRKALPDLVPVRMATAGPGPTDANGSPA